MTPFITINSNDRIVTMRYQQSQRTPLVRLMAYFIGRAFLTITMD
jgi:hypothetical protein